MCRCQRAPWQGALSFALATTLTLLLHHPAHAVDPSAADADATYDMYALPKAVPAWANEKPWSDLPSLFTSMTAVPGGRVYRNLWWHNHRFFGMVPADKASDTSLFDDGMAVGQVVTRMPVTDLPAFAAASRLAFVPGVSVLIDYPFLSLPDHLGHWAEVTVPTFSVLRDGKWRDAVAGAAGGTGHGEPLYMDSLLLPNMNRDMKPWFRVMLQAVCKPAMRPNTTWPTFIDYAELYMYDNLGWLVFENVVVAEDRYTHPQAKRGFVHTDHGDLWRHDNCQRWISPTHKVQFQTPEYGQDLRNIVWTMSGLGTPKPYVPGQPPALPKHITLLLGAPDEFPALVNEDEVRGALDMIARENGLQVVTVTLSNGSSFGNHLAPISQSAVVVGRQSSLMANTLFLPPGAMVLELLPYKWEWANLSMLYYNMTQSIGDIHHFAWRPTHYKYAKFKNESDLRYHTWTPEECEAYECLNKMRDAGLIADVPAVTNILKRKLPGVLKGEPVENLREPWPKAV